MRTPLPARFANKFLAICHKYRPYIDHTQATSQNLLDDPCAVLSKWSPFGCYTLALCRGKNKNTKNGPRLLRTCSTASPPELRIRSEGAGRKLNAGLRQLLHSWEEGIHPVILQVGHPEIRKLGYPSPNQANLPCLGPGRIRAPTLVCLF